MCARAVVRALTHCFRSKFQFPSRQWVRVWITISVSTCVWAQQTSTNVQQGGASFEWGWQLAPEGPGTIGHYYVKLPQAEQRVKYAADDSGYHGALAVNASDGHHTHTANFALGQRALELNGQQIPRQQYQLGPEANATTQLHPQGNIAPGNASPPLEIYLLQQQYPQPFVEQELFQVLPSAIPNNLIQYNPAQNYITNNNFPTPLYNLQQQHPIQYQNANYKSNDDTGNSRPLQKEDTNEQEHEVLTTSVVRVFKDHNCTNDENVSDSVAKESVSDSREPNKLTVETPKYDTRNINGNFGARDTTIRPLTYRGAVHFRVESPRENARSERYYYTTVSTPTQNYIDYKDEGISRLVASTQDLISNEDLLRINHAAEKHVNIHTEDIIKPRPRFSLKKEQTKYNYYNTPRNQITVKAKIGKIVDSEIHQTDNNNQNEQILQTSSNEYRFASPIVVADPSNSNYKEQIVNNIVSTMVPYIEEGYEIVSVRNTLEDDYKDNEEKENGGDESIDVTPRPIGQKYLAPITVALRLLNANDTETLNSVEDHDTSDSEPIPERVLSPNKHEKTIVEIQESIPVSITHINDVEVHEYLEEGRSNNKGPFDIAKSLYNKYVEALENSKKIQKNMNDFLYKYGTMKHHENSNGDTENRNNNDSRDNLDSSENTQTEVHVKPNEDSSNERSELVQYYNEYEPQNNKIIQPIVIEKEVPITKFVDRYIEKPYPEQVEVLKTVEVDRPVPYPVPYERIVEKPVEVTRFVDKPYPVEIHHPYPVEIKVPYPVEQKVYVDRPVHIPYPVEKFIEKQIVHTVPVPTPVAVPVEVQVPVEQKVLYPIPIETPVPYPVEVEKQVPVETVVHKEVPVPYPVEKRVPYPVPYETKVPVPYPVEKKVPVTVEKIVEKPVTVTKYIEKPVHIQVPVPHPVPVAVHVREPYPVDRIVEKKVPYPVPVDRIVEKKVPVRVPYPVHQVVEKVVEKPVVVTKYVDKPYPVEKRVPYPVEKIVEKKVPYPVQVPYEVKVPYPVDRIVEKPVHVPVKVPYPIERPAYGYAYGHGADQSQNVPQYLKYDQKQAASNQNQLQRNILQHMQEQAHALYLKEKQKQPIQSTHWGNQYASSFQYVNNTSPKINNDARKNLSEYLNYVSNSRSNHYYGPPPLQNYDDWWEKNKDYVVELKVRRTDRTPKVTKLRIEYGGFKPPLIPSTEVDLDGMPVKQGEDQT